MTPVLPAIDVPHPPRGSATPAGRTGGLSSLSPQGAGDREVLIDHGKIPGFCKRVPPPRFHRMTADRPPAWSLDDIGRFLAAFETPATGHARAELTDEQKLLIQALARGELAEDARRGLLPLLSSNETAIEYLARLATSDEAAEGDV